MDIKRADKLSSIAQKAISDIIQFKVKSDKIGFVTVTAAKVTNDLSYAKIYITTLNDNREKVVNTLNKAIKPNTKTILATVILLAKFIFKPSRGYHI